MKLLYLTKSIFLAFIILFLGQKVSAQCDVNTFTATPTNGTCFANATIAVQVPGAINCTNWIAILTPPSGSEQQLTIPANGGPVIFTSLEAGSYNVRLFNGLTTVQYSNNPVVVTTSYVSPIVTSTSTSTTCNPASTNYTDNATLTVNIDATSGTGPFVYTCAGATNSPSAPTMSRTYNFAGLAAGSYNFSVTDQPGISGCEVTVLQTRTIPVNANDILPATTSPFEVKKGCPVTCNTIRLYFFAGLLSSVNTIWRQRIVNNPDPNRAMISINGGVAVPMVVASSGVSYILDGFESPLLIPGDTWTATFTDGCDFTTASGVAPALSDDIFTFQGATTSVNCINQYSIRSNWNAKDWCVPFSIIVELEDPLIPGTFNPIPGSPFSSLNSNNRGIAVPSTGYYRVTHDDGCNLVVNYINVLEPTSNPLDNVQLHTFNTLRENTGGIRFVSNADPLAVGLVNTLSYPITYSIMPTNGDSSITYTASNPYNLAGTFTVNFPIIKTLTSNGSNYRLIRDLPGNTDYTITITDNCGYSVTRTITTLSATYNPTVSINTSCANSNTIDYDLDSPGYIFQSGTFTHATVDLYDDNGSGLPGNFIQNVYSVVIPTDINANEWKSQSVPNLPSGDYVLRFYNFKNRGYTLGFHYGATGDLPPVPGQMEEFYIPISIPVYQDIIVDLETSFCDPADANSGIVFAEISNGTPVYPLTWEIFDISNPTTPLQTYTANSSSDANALQQAFTNLSSGDYFTRVSSTCYILDTNITIDAAAQAPQVVASENVVCPGSNVVLTGIATLDGLYNIVWTDNFGNNLGTGSSIPVTVTQTTTYTATLTPSVGCINPVDYSSSITITVTDNPDFSLAVSDFDLCMHNGTDADITISNSQIGFTYEILDENGNSFVPAITGIGNGSDLIITIPAVNIPSVGTEYTVSTTNGNAGCSGILTDTILFYAGQLETNNVVNTVNVCNNLDGTITIINSVNGATYNIYNSTDLTTIIASGTSSGGDLNISVLASALTIGTNTFVIEVNGTQCTPAFLSNQAVIEVFGNIVQSGSSATLCNATGTDYTVSATFTGVAPFSATGTGAPGVWVDNGNGSFTWTSNTIANGAPYNIDFQDANACNTINLTDVSPICCVFEVICPTFPVTIVSCYTDIPTISILTEIDFEALGNSDGNIGDIPCGIIEITASNSPDPGCEGDITRTYIVTEYEDTNNNGVRDLGEDTVLNTQNCIQIFTIERNDFIMPVNASSTVSCPADVVTPTVPSVTDACGNALTPSAPVISTMPSCEGDVTYTYTFTDCEGNSHDWVYTYTIERNNFAMPVNASSIVACPADVVTPTVPNVTDACGNTLTPSAPVISTMPSCEGDVTYTYTFTDCEGNSHDWVYTYTIERNDFAMPVNASSIVACPADVVSPTVPNVTDACGNTLTPSAPVISTMPSCEGDVTYTYTFTDCEGNSHDWVYTYTIDDTIAPTGTAPSDLMFQCFADVPVADISVITDESDNCLGTVIVTVSDTDNGATGCQGNPFILTRTYSLTDCAGNTTNLIQTITVEDNISPVFTDVLPSDLVLECTDLVPTEPILTATDNCSNVTVVFDEQRIDGSCPSNYQLVRTWVATDVCGNNTTHVQTIDVQDTTPPVFVGDLPIDGFADCDNIPSPIAVTATDNCGNVTITFDEQRVDGNCSNRYQLIRTWTATDECGNSSTYTQTITLACHIKIWNAVSPNGDLSNDIFFLEGIDCYPINSVEIYNRWGIKVFETTGYDNVVKVFTGYSDGRSTISRNELLPTGTYFYVLKYEFSYDGFNGQKSIEKTGYLYIQNN